MNGRAGMGNLDVLMQKNQIGDVVKKGRVKSAGNRRKCMKRLKNVDEPKDVFGPRLDNTKRRSVVSTYPALGGI